MNQQTQQKQVETPVEFKEKDLHCIARIMGIKYMHNLFWACESNCRYCKACAKQIMYQEKGRPHYFDVMRKLEQVTGLYLGILVNRFEAEEGVEAMDLFDSEPFHPNVIRITDPDSEDT